MSIVFVGEAPSKPNVHAFWPFLPGSGRRLAMLLGMESDEFWSWRNRNGVVLINLFGEPVGGWNPGLAVDKSLIICQEYLRVGPGLPRWDLVMLGRRVAEAFQDDRDYFEVRVTEQGNRAVVVPHPSGRCRVWNDKKNVRKFRKVMMELGAIP